MQSYTNKICANFHFSAFFPSPNHKYTLKSGVRIHNYTWMHAKTINIINYLVFLLINVEISVTMVTQFSNDISKDSVESIWEFNVASSIHYNLSNVEIINLLAFRKNWNGNRFPIKKEANQSHNLKFTILPINSIIRFACEENNLIIMTLCLCLSKKMSIRCIGIIIVFNQ